MPTIEYHNAKGKRISGNTGLLDSNLGWNKRALMIWKEGQCIDAARETFIFTQDLNDGMIPDEFERMLRETINKKAEEAPTVGTLLHYLIECDLLRQEPKIDIYSSEIVSLAETAFLNYCQWRDSVKLEPISVEPHLVSEKYQFGTTPDAICRINDHPSLFEWKTSKKLYEDYLLQVAAQKVAWEENHPDILLTGGFHVLRIDKDTGAFTHSWWQSLTEAWELFECVLRLHFGRKKLAKILG